MKNLIFASMIILISSCGSGAKKTSDTTSEHQSTHAPNGVAHSSSETKTSSSAPLKADIKGSSLKTVCQSNKDIRELNVITTETRGCELQYQKFGKTDIVAKAKRGTQHCEEVFKRIKSKLGDSKFTCE